MQVREVTTPGHWRDFHRVAHYIYRRDPHWIAPIHADIEKIFTPATNKTYAQGEARLWVLYGSGERPIGRIAAFIDGKRNAERDYNTGGIGFFECVNDPAAAQLLFDTAEGYLLERGMDGIEGPVNFGERDKFWGLHTWGWYPPVYQENYHAPYYRAFFTNRGYLPHEQIFTYHGEVQGFDFDRIIGISGKLRERYGITTRAINPRQLDVEAAHFAEVYNEAFRHFPHFKALQAAQIEQVFKQMKPVMDPNLICFAFADHKPVGFCALMPEINAFLRGANGRLNWRTIPGFLWRKTFLRPQTAKGVAFGISTEWQRKGVFACIVEHLYHYQDKANPRRYHDILLATIRSHNTPMTNVIQSLAVQPQREHLTLRKALREGFPIDPYPMTPLEDKPGGQPPALSVYPQA